MLIVAVGMVNPDGKVVTSDGVPEPFVARTALLTTDVPATAVPLDA